MNQRGMRLAFASCSCMTLAVFVAPSVAAHPAGAMGLVAGLAHPWTGADHVAAMFAIGCWAAVQGRHSQWALPLAALAGVAAGSCTALIGLFVPSVELMTVLSVVALGVLIAWRTPASSPGALLIVACFGLFHGYAHMMEIPQHASGLLFTSGFMLSTLLLQLCGALFWWAMVRHRMRVLVGCSGACMAIAGALLLAGG